MLFLIHYLHPVKSTVLQQQAHKMKKVFQELTASADASFIVKQEQALQFAAPYHFHHGYEFTYIVKGHGKFYGGDRLMNFKEGDIYFFGPGFAHYFVNDTSFVKAGEPAHSIIVQFDETLPGWDFFLKPEFKLVKELLKSAHLGIKISKTNKAAQSLLSELTKHSGLKALILFFQLLDTVSALPKKDLTTISLSSFKGSLNDTASNKMEAVYQYVLENFKAKVHTKKAASLAHMNEAAFCRYFKRRTKKTLSQFVNNVRVTHAMYLLTEKGMSISDICFECGFDNLSYFNRQFKLITSKTPFIFRKEFLV